MCFEMMRKIYRESKVFQFYFHPWASWDGGSIRASHFAKGFRALDLDEVIFHRGSSNWN